MGTFLNIPIKAFWVICSEDEDFNEEFGQEQFEAADDYLNKSRKEKPEYKFSLIAEIDA